MSQSNRLEALRKAMRECSEDGNPENAHAEGDKLLVATIRALVEGSNVPEREREAAEEIATLFEDMVKWYS